MLTTATHIFGALFYLICSELTDCRRWVARLFHDCSCKFSQKRTLPNHCNGSEQQQRRGPKSPNKRGTQRVGKRERQAFLLLPAPGFRSAAEAEAAADIPLKHTNTASRTAIPTNIIDPRTASSYHLYSLCPDSHPMRPLLVI